MLFALFALLTFLKKAFHQHSPLDVFPHHHLPVLFPIHLVSSKMAAQDATLCRLHAAIDEFYTDETTRSEDTKLLLSYLAAKPSFTQPVDILAVDEIESRIEIVQEIQKFIQEQKPDWHVTALRLAIFMVMPMGTLLKLKEDLVTTDELALVSELEKTHMLVIDCKVFSVF